MILRDYQQEALGSILAAFEEGARSVLAVMATGTGKTQVFAHLAKHYVDRGRVMVIAHREELVEQARQKLQQIALVPVDVEMADQRAAECGMFEDRAPIVVSSVQTLSTGRINRFDPGEFSLLICDEAHHCPAETWLSTIRYFCNNEALKVFGCTATPDRADEEALGHIFERCAYEFEINNAIEAGWLVDVRRRAVNIEELDFSEIRTVAGDLNQGQLEAEMTKYESLHGVADATIKESGNRPTICFAVSVAHAEKLCEILNRHRKDCAQFVYGETPKGERRGMFRGFLEGRFQYLCNVGVATEGVDLPLAACIVVARPTKSRALYTQMLGRGTRPLSGIVDGIETIEGRRASIKDSDKPDLLVVDFTGNSGRHELVSAVDVLGAPFNPDLLKDIETAMQDGTRTFAEAVAEANRQRDARREAREQAKLAMERERALARARAQTMREVRGRATYSVVDIDAKDPFDVLNVPKRETRGWDRGKQPTANMLAFLERAGIDNAATFDMGNAGRMIAAIKNRWNKGLCTFKQARLLAKYKYDPEGISLKEATRIIDAIKANGWRRHVESPQA